MIKLSDIRNNRIKLSDIKKYFEENINKDVYFLSDFDSILYQCLQHFNFKNLANSRDSIEKNCLKIAKAAVPFKSLHDDPYYFFIKVILGLDELPIIHKIKLETVAKKDLKDLDILIDHYGTLDFIQNYNKLSKNPRNHEEKKVLEFYQRTISKRQNVVDYIFNKLEDIAFEKSKHSIFGKEYEKLKQNAQMQKFNRHSDFPYTDIVFENASWGYKIDFERLDYRRINPMRNKIDYFKFKSDTTQGYTASIIKEFSKQFKKNQAILLLNKLLNKISSIPILKNRKEIFIELLHLYKLEKWYGFYALALPQIEGLFSEMIDIVEPSKIRGSFSLPDKVKLVRPFSENSLYFFDYFEYYLPDQRNKFSHTGKDEGIQIKSSFLLLDLLYVVDIFETLDTPLIELNNIIKEGIYYFNHIGKFHHFLYLLNEIKPKQLFEISTHLNEFVIKNLIVRIDFLLFIKELEDDFIMALEKTKEIFPLLYYSEYEEKIDLFSLSKSHIHQNRNKIETILNSKAFMLFDELKILKGVTTFLSNFKKRFPELPKEIQIALDKFEDGNKQNLTILNAAFLMFSPEEMSGNMYLSKDWNHIKLLS